MSEEMTESTAWIDFLAWVEVNKKRLLYGMLVLAVAGLGYAVMQNARSQKEITAAKALLQLRVPMNAPTNAPAIPAASFAKVAQEHAGTDAAERAMILHAGALYDEGRYAEAQGEFQKFVTAHPASPWAPTAATGAAAALEAQNKPDDALRAYQNVASSYPASSVIDQVKFAQARIYEAKNQAEQALKIYDDLGKNNNSPRGNEAQQARELLVKKFPQLAKAALTPNTALSAFSAAMSNALPAKPVNN